MSRDAKVSIRLTPEELGSLESLAAREGLSVSEMVRRSLEVYERGYRVTVSATEGLLMRFLDAALGGELTALNTAFNATVAALQANREVLKGIQGGQHGS